MSLVWGVNAHHSYALPAAKQSATFGQKAGYYTGVAPFINPNGGWMTLLSTAQSLGLSSVRIDVYDASQATINWLTPLVAAAKVLGMTVLPVLCPGSASSEAGALNANAAFGAAIAKAFPTITQWEAGNELDEYAIKPGKAGTVVGDYDVGRYALVRGAIKGLMAGIKSVLPKAQVAVNITGVHFVYLQQLWNDGLRWDITSEHFYVNPGSTGIQSGADTAIFPNLARFGKPIMMTEFNQQNGSQLSADPATLIAMMDAMKNLATKYNIIGAYIYELLDEPSQPANEAHYGLASSAAVVNAFGAAVRTYLNT